MGITRLESFASSEKIFWKPSDMLKNCWLFSTFPSSNFGLMVLAFTSMLPWSEIEAGLPVLAPGVLKKFVPVFDQIVFTVFVLDSLRILFFWLYFSWLMDVA